MDDEKKFFDSFVKKYNLNIKELSQKVNHTYRVANFSKEIAIDLNLNENEINNAYISGLFHDLGRFPQFSEFKTFRDEKSFDHGDKSYEILKKYNYQNNLVLDAVKYHNKLTIPLDLNEIKKLQCEIVRDADKLDIMNYNWEIGKIDYKITDDILKYFETQKMIPNEAVKNRVDGILRQLAFIYDINFNVTLDKIANLKVIRKNVDLIYNTCLDENVFYVKYLLEEYLKNKLGEKSNERVRKKI